MRLRNYDGGSGNIVEAIIGAIIVVPLLLIICIYLLSTIFPALQSAAPDETAAEIIRNTENTGYLALALLSLGGGAALFLAALLKKVSN